MFALKRHVRSAGAALAIAAACLSTSAQAGFDAPVGWGVGPNNNGWGIGGPINNGFRGPIDNGPRPGEVGTFRGVGSRQNFGFPGQEYSGYGGGAAAASFGMSMSRGFGMYPYAPMFGINPYMSYGFRPVGFGVDPQQSWNMKLPSPLMWGFDPQQSMGLLMPPHFGIDANLSYGFRPVGFGVGRDFGPINGYIFGIGPDNNGWGMVPQQNFGFGPFPALGMDPQQSVGMPMFNPWMGMNPYAQMPMQPASAQQQGGLQGVQCTINGVGVLTKDADDCEKADGEVVKAKTAKQ